MPPMSESLMRFGKHAGLSYQEVKDNFPEYCQWALAECLPDDDGKASVARQEFVRWLTASSVAPKAATSTGAMGSRQTPEVQMPAPNMATQRLWNNLGSVRREVNRIGARVERTEDLLATVMREINKIGAKGEGIDKKPGDAQGPGDLFWATRRAQIQSEIDAQIQGPGDAQTSFSF